MLLSQGRCESCSSRARFDDLGEGEQQKGLPGARGWGTRRLNAGKVPALQRGMQSLTDSSGSVNSPGCSLDPGICLAARRIEVIQSDPESQGGSTRVTFVFCKKT